MLVNVMDFGMVVTLYRGAPTPTRKGIARALGVEPKVLDSWLVALNTVRNVCAHHGRLWNRVIGTSPAIPRRKNDPRWREPFEVPAKTTCGILTILSYLLGHVAPGTAWGHRLLALLEDRPAEDLRRMGFSESWRECPFWRRWLDAG